MDIINNKTIVETLFSGDIPTNIYMYDIVFVMADFIPISTVETTRQSERNGRRKRKK